MFCPKIGGGGGGGTNPLVPPLLIRPCKLTILNNILTMPSPLWNRDKSYSAFIACRFGRQRSILAGARSAGRESTPSQISVAYP